MISIGAKMVDPGGAPPKAPTTPLELLLSLSLTFFRKSSWLLAIALVRAGGGRGWCAFGLVCVCGV